MELFFLWFFNGYSMMYDYVGGIRDHLVEDLALQFCSNQSKVISKVTETYINHDQIGHIRNCWLGPIFFSPADSLTKNGFSCFLWVFKISMRLRMIQKGRLCPLRWFPLMAVLQGIAPGNSRLWGLSLKDYKIVWKAKMREMKTK